MRLNKSISGVTGDIVFGPYSPTPVRKGGELARLGLQRIQDAVRAKRYGALLFWGGAVFFVFSFFAFLLSLPPRSSASWAAVSAAPAAAIVSPSVQTLEVHIANNGLVLLRSARVLSVNGNLIKVSIAWGSANFTWTVRTNAVSYETRNFGTHILDREGNVISIDDIKAGQYLTITGMLDTTQSEPTLDASAVRQS